MKKKRTEIVIEIDELTIINRRNASVRRWCSRCRSEQTMVSPEQASGLAGVSVRTVNKWVESDEVHFLETQDGLLWICANSLK